MSETMPRPEDDEKEDEDELVIEPDVEDLSGDEDDQEEEEDGA